MNKFIWIAFLLCACGDTTTVNNTGPSDPPDPPLIHENCTDWEVEDNSTLELSEFIGHLGHGDDYYICGVTDTMDFDNFLLFPEKDGLLNIDLQCYENVACYIQLYRVNFKEIEGEFVFTYTAEDFFGGDPGELVVLMWPLEYSEYGYVFSVKGFGPTDYQMQLWVN